MLVFLLVTVEAVYRFADLRTWCTSSCSTGSWWRSSGTSPTCDMNGPWKILHNSLVTGANIGVLFLFAGAENTGCGWWTVFLLAGASFLVGTSSASYMSLLFGVCCPDDVSHRRAADAGALSRRQPACSCGGTGWTVARSCGGARTITP